MQYSLRLVSVMAILITTSTFAVQVQGIEFPLGAFSFADVESCFGCQVQIPVQPAIPAWSVA